jgi:hypothetical protein
LTKLYTQHIVFFTINPRKFTHRKEKAMTKAFTLGLAGLMLASCNPDPVSSTASAPLDMVAPNDLRELPDLMETESAWEPPPAPDPCPKIIKKFEARRSTAPYAVATSFPYDGVQSPVELTFELHRGAIVSIGTLQCQVDLDKEGNVIFDQTGHPMVTGYEFPTVNVLMFRTPIWPGKERSVLFKGYWDRDQSEKVKKGCVDAYILAQDPLNDQCQNEWQVRILILPW